MHYRTAQLHKETVLVIRLHDSPRSATGRLLQLPRKSGMTSRNATSESGGEGPVRAGSAGSATPAEVRKVNNPVRAAFSARVCSGQNSHWRWDLFIGSEFGHFLPVVWPSIRCCDASLMWDRQPIKWIFFRPNQKFSHNKTKTKHNLPHEKKNRPPRGFGSTQLIRAVLANKFYLAVKELQQRGRSLSELFAEQLDADPIGTLTTLKAYLPVKWGDASALACNQRWQK